MTENTQPGTGAVPEGVREAEEIRHARAFYRYLARLSHDAGTLDEPLDQVLAEIDAGKFDRMAPR